MDSSRPSTSTNSSPILYDREYNALLYQKDYLENLLYLLNNPILINQAVMDRKGIMHLHEDEVYFDLDYLLKIGEFDEFGNLGLTPSERAIPLKNDKNIGIESKRFVSEASNENDWSNILISSVLFAAGNVIQQKVINWRSKYTAGSSTPRQLHSEVNNELFNLQKRFGKLKLTPNQYTLSTESILKLKLLLQELISKEKSYLSHLSKTKKAWELAVHEVYEQEDLRRTFIERKISEDLSETLTNAENVLNEVDEILTDLDVSLPSSSDKGKEKEIPSLPHKNFYPAKENFTYLTLNTIMSENIIALANYWINFLRNNKYWEIQYATSGGKKFEGFKFNFLDSFSGQPSNKNKQKLTQNNIEIPNDIKELQHVISEFEKSHPHWQLEDPHVALGLIINLREKAKTLKVPAGATKSHKEVLRRLRAPLFLTTDGAYRLADLPREREKLVEFIATRKNITWRDKRAFLLEDPYFQANETRFRAEVDRKLGTQSTLKKSQLI